MEIPSRVRWHHIYPDNDVIEHVVTTIPGIDEVVCQCNPVFDYEYKIVIHGALDGRKTGPTYKKGR